MATTVRGDAAHDAVDIGNPVKIGGKASTNAPTAVSVGDRVAAWIDTEGRIHVTSDAATPLHAGGNVAHDAADAGNPIKTGGKGVTSRPAAASATGDRVDAYYDLHGRQVVVTEQSHQDVTRTATISADMQVAAAISPTPASGLKLVVDELYISTVAAEIVTLTEETSGTVLGTIHTRAGGVDKVRLGKLPTATKRLMASLASAGDVSFILLSRTEA